MDSRRKRDGSSAGSPKKACVAAAPPPAPAPAPAKRDVRHHHPHQQHVSHQPHGPHPQHQQHMHHEQHSRPFSIAMGQADHDALRVVPLDRLRDAAQLLPTNKTPGRILTKMRVSPGGAGPSADPPHMMHHHHMDTNALESSVESMVSGAGSSDDELFSKAVDSPSRKRRRISRRLSSGESNVSVSAPAVERRTPRHHYQPPGQPIVEDAVDVSSASFVVAGPSRPMTSMSEEKKKIKKMRVLYKKQMARLPAEQRARLQELRDRKEVGQFLMPNAPPGKKRRNVSPVRVPCPLVPGTPEVPPPRIPQKWELHKSALDASGRSSFELEEAAATPPPTTKENQIVFIPSPGAIVFSEEEQVDEALIDVASIELVGVSPSTSFYAERPSPTLQNFSPEPSTSSTRPGPSIYEEDPDNEILQWQCSAGLNPGSDIEDEDCLGDLRTLTRHAGRFAVEDLPSELCEALGSMDRQDDCALRESSKEDLLTFDWSHDPQVFTGVRENFPGPAGPTFSTAGMSPFQIFSKIWDADIINLIVDETNKYATNLLSSSLPQYSRLRKWKPITPEDLWTFFGIIMLQSIVPISVEREFWFPCLPYLKVGTIADIMPFNRFVLIKRCLHFADNTLYARGSPNKLRKIQPIIDHLNEKFSSLYLPEQEIAIDESLMLWSGRLSFSQLIARKAAQVGIKSYELCESKTGYLWQMIIYTGKREWQNVDANQDEAELEGTSSRTVLELVRPLLNRGHTLVMDNFYNSPLLARILKTQKTDVMGTLRRNREFVPDSLRQKNKANMRSGEVAFSQTRDLTISVWKDANVVSLISTYHRVEVGGKEKYGYYKYKPQVVLDYNMAMGGVDKKDQLLQAFPIERVRNPIWYKKLFRRLLNVSVHNAFIMFSKTRTHKMAQRQFRLMLADEIIQRFRPLPVKMPLPVNSHFPAKTNLRKSRCKWCALKKVDACTVFKCESCNVNLCIIGCFKDYHISRGLVM